MQIAFVTHNEPPVASTLDAPDIPKSIWGGTCGSRQRCVIPVCLRMQAFSSLNCSGIDCSAFAFRKGGGDFEAHIVFMAYIV